MVAEKGLDLRQCDLRSKDMADVNFAGALMFDADFRKANLEAVSGGTQGGCCGNYLGTVEIIWGYLSSWKYSHKVFTQSTPPLCGLSRQFCCPESIKSQHCHCRSYCTTTSTSVFYIFGRPTSELTPYYSILHSRNALTVLYSGEGKRLLRFWLWLGLRLFRAHVNLHLLAFCLQLCALLDSVYTLSATW